MLIAFKKRLRRSSGIMKNNTEVDWRLQGQENYLKGVKLIARVYNAVKGWDHDHCEFCGAKFSNNEGDLHQGYSTVDSYHWICKDCFNDFKDQFEWTIDSE